MLQIHANTMRMRDPSSKMLQIVRDPRCRHHANERSKLQKTAGTTHVRDLSSKTLQMPGRTTSARKRGKQTEKKREKNKKHATLCYVSTCGSRCKTVLLSCVFCWVLCWEQHSNVVYIYMRSALPAEKYVGLNTHTFLGGGISTHHMFGT